MTLARNYYTPIDYWLGLTLSDLRQSIDENNEMMESLKKKR